MRVLIIEDELKARVVLKKQLDKCAFNNLKLAEAEGVVDGLRMISQFKPEIVFLDIELKDGDGFDVLEIMNDRSFEVIIVTGKEDFALKAIKNRVADYVLKPVDKDDIQEAIEKALNRKKAFEVLPQKTVSFNTKNSIHKVNVDDILYCESDGNYTTVVLLNNNKIVVSKKLGEIEEQLQEFDFLRVHRSFIVRVSSIIAFNKIKNKLQLKEGGFVSVSRANRSDVLDLLSDND